VPPLPEPAPPDPEPEVPPPEVAPFGVTPPPVGPEAPLEPEPLVPLDAVPPALDVPEDPDELAPDDDADPDEESPLDAEEDVVVVVEVVLVLLVEAGDWEATVAVGTVSAGAPAVSVGGELPPHAASPAHSARPASTRALRPRLLRPVTARLRGTGETSDVERLHAPSAVGAVVQILLAELVAPVAEAEVLDRPGQLR
jgi:hypothetical protein